MPYTTLVSGTVITASWANASVRDQVTTPFATTAARTSAITVPIEGMVTYQADTDQLEVYDGATWAIAAHVGAWTAQTPAWAAATSNPSIGNGSITAKVMQVGKLFIQTGIITMGSTTTFGSGAWRVSLGATVSNTLHNVGSTVMLGTSRKAGSAWPSGVTDVQFMSELGDVTATVPVTWANGDQLRWTYIAEVV